MTARRIGILGGTFDPIHMGHLILGTVARSAVSLDAVHYVVANNPWMRPEPPRTPAETRFAMVERALEGVEAMVADRTEIDRGGPSFTIDTVQAILERDADARVVLILGADAAAGLPSWHAADALSQLVEIAVVSREGVTAPILDARWRVTPFAMPTIALSSTWVRSRVALGLPVEFLVPQGVSEMIRHGSLYIEGRSGEQD